MSIQKKLIQMGTAPIVCLGTLISVFSSLIITFVLLWLTGSPFLPMFFIIAAIAPALIAPMVIIFFLRLLFRIHTLEQKTREMATKDTLTQLLNRGSFFENVDALHEIAELENYPISLLYIDLDHFKSINDQYGHQAGDEVLKLFGKILNETKRKKDLAGRIGGEEFAVFLPETDSNGALIFAEKIRKIVESSTVTIRDVTIQFTVSIGITNCLNEQCAELDELVFQADKALYQAKESGRNRSVCYQAGE